MAGTASRTTARRATRTQKKPRQVSNLFLGYTSAVFVMLSFCAMVFIIDVLRKLFSTLMYQTRATTLSIFHLEVSDLLFALNKFAQERRQPDLYPNESLLLQPVLAFLDGTAAPTPPPDFSFLRISSLSSGRFEGALA